MKPPICTICDKDLVDPDEGGLIYFRKRPSDIKWEEKMEEIEGVGHPPNAEWFCKNHYKKASELTHLPINEVLKILRSDEP